MVAACTLQSAQGLSKKIIGELNVVERLIGWSQCWRIWTPAFYSRRPRAPRIPADQALGDYKRVALCPDC